MSDEALASHFDRLRGRILGMIEAVGFPADRERAIKQLYKSLTYDMEAEIDAAFVTLQDEVIDLRIRVKELENHKEPVG